MSGQIYGGSGETMADPVFYDKKLPENIDVYMSDTGKLLQEGDI